MVGENCDQTCQNNGLKCTEDGLRDHNGDVDSSEKVIALINQLGVTFNPTTPCPDNVWNNAPDVPIFSLAKDYCFYASPHKSVFSCTAISKALQEETFEETNGEEISQKHFEYKHLRRTKKHLQKDVLLPTFAQSKWRLP